jgi:DNA invertase Pin-like site-specific DNA recombinase
LSSGARLQAHSLDDHLRNHWFSGISATEARWRAFATAAAPLLVFDVISSLTGRYSMLKTRLQLSNFSRIPYLYKAPRNEAVKSAMAKRQTVNVPRPLTRQIGYARVSTDDQVHDAQIDELRAAGCDRIYQEHGSGASRARPVLTKLLGELTAGELTAGDVLVVVRLDRLARSVSHLLAVIEDLEERGVHFRSIRDPIDTSTPQGMFSLQVLGAVAQLERALIAERTKAGIKAAKARGRLPGNPGLRERRPEAIKAVSKAREKLYLDELVASAQTWLPLVQQLRPQHSWDNVVRVLNRRGHDWTVERLRRAVHRLVREKLAEKELLTRSPRRAPEDHLMKLVAAIAIADPDLSLRDIAAQLDQMGERPVRGGKKWQPSSVRDLLDEAHRFGLIRR